MKKFLFIIFALTLCLFAICFENPEVSANTENNGELISSSIEYFEDGSYLTTECFVISETKNSRNNTRTVLHTVTATHYSATNKELWFFKLTGGWYVNDGISVMAMSSVIDYELYSNAWSYSDLEATYYDDIVHGGAIFTHKLLGITTKTITIDFDLLCDVYGNVTRI